MQDPEDQGNTLLHWAVGYNQINIARLIVENGGMIIVNEAGITPLDLVVKACTNDPLFIPLKNFLARVKT